MTVSRSVSDNSSVLVLLTLNRTIMKFHHIFAFNLSFFFFFAVLLFLRSDIYFGLFGAAPLYRFLMVIYSSHFQCFFAWLWFIHFFFPPSLASSVCRNVECNGKLYNFSHTGAVLSGGRIFNWIARLDQLRDARDACAVAQLLWVPYWIDQNRNEEEWNRSRRTVPALKVIAITISTAIHCPSLGGTLIAHSVRAEQQ